MPALLAALDHEVGIKRRGGWFLGAGVGLLALGLWFGLRSEAPAAEPPCRNAQALLRDAWSPERRAAIDRAFHASSLPYARSTWTSVQARLASYADRWASVYTDACEAHNVRRDQSGDILDRRMLCLDHRRLELDALTLVLARGEAAAIEQADAGIDRLGDLAACSDIDALTALVDPPRGELKAEVDRIAAQVAEASALELAGDWRAAHRLSTVAVAAATAAGYAPLTAEALRVHARLQRLLDEPTPAVESLLSAARAAAAGRDERAAAEIWIDLVFIAGYDLNEATTAAAYANAASAALLRVGADPLLSARLDVNISAVHQRLGATEEALAAGLRALAVFDADPATDPSRRHRLLGNLGLIYKARKQSREAREAFTRALELVRHMSGPDHPAVATILTNLGELALDEGNLDEARTLADEAAAIRRRALPPEHLAFADGEQLFASIAEARKDTGAALAHLRRALDLYRRTPRPSPAKLAALYNNLANLAVAENHFEEAIAHYRDALAGFTEVGGPDHPYTLTVESNLGEVLLALNRPEQALPLHTHFAAVMEREYGRDHPDTAAALVAQALNLRALNDPKAALPLLERALPILTAAVAAGTAERGPLGLCRYALARTLADLRQGGARQLLLLAEPDLAADTTSLLGRLALADLPAARR
jgi:tetratricopeptide (TPR) repeat protein